MPTEHKETPKDWAGLAQDYLKLWQEFYTQALKDPSLYEAWNINPTAGPAAFTAPSFFGMAQSADYETRLRALEERIAELEHQVAKLSTRKS